MPLPVDLFDLESGVPLTWANCVLILVFLGLSVLELDRMYATDTSLDAYFCAVKAIDPTTLSLSNKCWVTNTHLFLWCIARLNLTNLLQPNLS